MDDGSSGIGSGSAALTGGASGDKPRQKRKYTRKLGPDGLPLKRRTGVSVGRKSLIPDDGKPKKRGRPRKADKEREIRDKERAKEEDEEFNTLDLLQQESPGRGPGPEDFRAPGDADGEAGPANATVNANASDIPIDANDDEDDIVDMDTWAEFAKGGKKRDGINHLTLERTLTTADYERYVMAYRGGLQKASVKKVGICFHWDLFISHPETTTNPPLNPHLTLLTPQIRAGCPTAHDPANSAKHSNHCCWSCQDLCRGNDRKGERSDARLE